MQERPVWLECLAALALVGLATILRHLLSPLLGSVVPYALYYPVLAYIGWTMRAWVAILAVATAALAGWYFFLLPQRSITVTEPADVWQLASFLIIAGVMVAMSRYGRDARTREGCAVQAHEHELSDFFDNASVGMHWVGPDGVILRVNQAELSMLGYERREYVGRHIAEFHVDQPVISEITQRLTRGEEIREVLARMRCKDGSIRHVRINPSVYRVDGRFVHTRCFTHDVTTQIQAQASEAEARDQLVLVSNMVPALLAYVDRDQRYQLVNEEYRRWFGVDPASMRGRRIQEVLGPDAWREIEPHITHALAGQTVTFETEIKYRTGPRFVHVKYVPDIDHQGGVRGLVALVNDRSEVRQAETDRRRLAAMVESSEDAIIGTTLDRLVTSWNAGATRLFGYTSDEMIGQPLARLMPPDRRAEEDDLRERLSHGERIHAFETVRMNKAGERVDVSVSLSPVRDAAGAIIAISKIVRDIRPQKKALSVQRATETRFQTMADHAPVLIWMADAAMQATWFNRPWLEFVGRSIEAERGSGWLLNVHREDREALRLAHAAALDSRTAFSHRFRLRRADGTYRWMLKHGVPLFADEDFIGYIGSLADITDSVEAQAVLQKTLEDRTAELHASYERLRFSERRASLGTLATGLGHDIGNLMIPLRVRLQSLEALGLPESAMEDVRSIRTFADYLQRLAGGLRLLALDPSKAGQAEATRVHAWWAESEPILKNALPRHVRLESDLPSSEVVAPMSRPALTQAAFNLVQNAGDAMRTSPAGTVRLTIQSSEDECVVEVRDDGPGMSAEVRARCIEPFFSTKTRAVTTGLGLSIVSGLVSEAGGRMEIESEPGHGSTFRIRLPVTRSAASEPVAPIRARVEVADPRMRAFLRHELKHPPFQLVDEPDTGDPIDVRVIDADRLPTVAVEALSTTRVIALGDAPATAHPHIRILARSPRPQAVREALSACAQDLRSVRA